MVRHAPICQDRDLHNRQLQLGRDLERLEMVKLVHQLNFVTGSNSLITTANCSSRDSCSGSPDQPSFKNTFLWFGNRECSCHGHHSNISAVFLLWLQSCSSCGLRTPN